MADDGDARRFSLVVAVGLAVGGLLGAAIALSVPWWGWVSAGALVILSSLSYHHSRRCSGRRAQTAVALALILLVAAPGVVVAAHIAGTVPIQGGVTLNSSGGMAVTVEGSTDALLEDPFTLSGTVNVVTEDGNVTFFSSGVASATIHSSNISGTFTNVTGITANPNTIQIDPADKQEVTVGGGIDHVAWIDDTEADDGTVDFTYGGSGTDSRVTLTNVTAGAELEAVDASTNNILDKATATAGGHVTFDGLDNSDHAVLLQTQDANDAPVLSNPTPTGPQTTAPSSFSADVNDSEFSQGDTVTAELFIEQTSQGTDTLTSNGTATVSASVDLGRSIDYSWVATDEWGDTDTINASLTTPVNVTFREETNASEVITGADATIILYSVDATTIVRRTDSDNDGNISLEGLPDKEFVVVANASQHYTRRVYVESIFEQQNIFLLNSTRVPGAEAINTTFVFEDRTGEFPPENTTLRIQRALDVNDDDTFEWLTVAGDFWGAASEFPFTGEQNARYRLIVENRQGERRVLGTHIPVEDGVKTVINGEIRWEKGNATGIFADAAINRTDSEIEGFYTDPADSTSEIRVQVWELGNRSNEIFDQNFTGGPYGTLALDPIVSLTGAQTDTSWVVRLTYTHGGETDTAQLTVGAPQVSIPADPWLLAAFGLLGITFVGTLYGPRTATIGAWSMVLAALGLTVFGIANFPIVGIVAGVGVAAGGTLYSEAVP